MDKSRKEDESEKNDEPIEQEETRDESDTLPVEFEDQMYKLMQETEMAMEYQEMTTEQENELVSQLTPREKAEYREMREYYQLQAEETEQGMGLRSAEIKEKARQRAPGLPIDLIQQVMKEEPDIAKRDIEQVTEVQWQAILWKREKTPRTTRPGTEKGYYIYIEDESSVYLETIDEQGVPTLVLDTKTDRHLPTDRIMEWDTDKYFAPPEDQEDEHDTETISSMSTKDYDRDKVETSLAMVAEAFHTIESKYR